MATSWGDPTSKGLLRAGRGCRGFTIFLHGTLLFFSLCPSPFIWGGGVPYEWIQQQLSPRWEFSFFRFFFAVVVLVPRQGHLYHLCDRSALSFRHYFPFNASSTMDIFITLHPHPSTFPFCDHHYEQMYLLVERNIVETSMRSVVCQVRSTSYMVGSRPLESTPSDANTNEFAHEWKKDHFSATFLIRSIHLKASIRPTRGSVARSVVLPHICKRRRGRVNRDETTKKYVGLPVPPGTSFSVHHFAVQRWPSEGKKRCKPGDRGGSGRPIPYTASSPPV
jgi:hypothetical protein